MKKSKPDRAYFWAPYSVEDVKKFTGRYKTVANKGTFKANYEDKEKCDRRSINDQVRAHCVSFLNKY